MPWEDRQRVGRFPAFWATARRTMFAPGASFALVPPRTGRLWDPLSYALFANSLVMLAVCIIGVAIFGGVLAFAPKIADAIGWIALGIAALVLVAIPVAVLARVFLLAGVEHVVLLLTGGAPQGFEATLRAHCYSSGPTVFALVPVCGPYVSEIWQIVLRIHGYRAVHQIPGGRAAAAVIFPIAVCLFGYVVLVAKFQH